MTAVSVQLGTTEYGLPLASVREVLRAPAITPTPAAPADICGIAQVRGTLLAVVDLGTRLGGPAAAATGRLVVVHGADGEPLGLLVDAIGGLVEVPGDLQPAPAEAEAALPAHWLAGIAALPPDRLVAVLNLDRVLSGERA